MSNLATFQWRRLGRPMIFCPAFVRFTGDFSTDSVCFAPRIFSEPPLRRPLSGPADRQKAG
jgi:hypothetical protein